ncbi:M61 family metallopeptidase [Novosphingobium sp. Gsoil 351]|uniref:M61 family metallopeptidase n=1 Tax=Novosphingobium sp. Gsoil 351 TaxID=2675225 RepID=UPI0012B501A4|nr:M61 family metallopeptidase [Novosphingobium sp. Gsoil 351]QGN54675.1 peptidase M61 [Novosphingobium sp. Gsoil 351]
MHNARAVAPLLAALLLATSPLAAQAQRSTPMALPISSTIPAAQDVPYPGTMGLDIDATDVARGVYRVTQTIPVRPGASDFVLLLPQWLPGNHSPTGNAALINDLRFTANGKPLAWRRDPVDVYAFHVAIPDSAREVTARFVHTSPLQSSEGRITMTREMLNLQWEKMSLYPAGFYVRQIKVKPTVKFPEGWTVFTALDGRSTKGSTVSWAATEYDALVDSPVFAGKHAVRTDIGHGVWMDAIADKPELLAIAPNRMQTYRNLTDEALALFGARHFDHYDFLLALTDRMGSIGLEHHRSSENQYEPRDWIEWDKMDWDHNVIPHEFVHSWNGKYRRPADLWTPDYRTPMQDSLLWVYEGQTQFWGYVLAARSGVQNKQTVLDMFAAAAATYSEGQPGRGWRSVEDTTNDPIINRRRPVPYTSLTRSEDYYTEGALVWLEADQVIRQGTRGARGLDDFARAFFGMRDGDWGELTYDFDEVVRTLNAVYPYDWATFLTTRIKTPGQPAPLAGIEQAGYRLVWKDKPNSYDEGRYGNVKSTNLAYSLGLSLDGDGKVTGVRWDSPAFDAGLVTGSQIIAINEVAYSADEIKSAITAAKGGKEPLRLIVKRGDSVRTVPVDWHGGLRYPWLEKTTKGEAGLDRLLAPKVRK